MIFNFFLLIYDVCVFLLEPDKKVVVFFLILEKQCPLM